MAAESIASMAGVIVVSLIVIGVAAALAAGSIMSLQEITEMKNHCLLLKDCGDKTPLQLAYVQKWGYFFTVAFLGVGVVAAGIVAFNCFRIYGASRGAGSLGSLSTLIGG